MVISLFGSCGKKNTGNTNENPIDIDFWEVTRTSMKVETKYPATLEGTVNVNIRTQVTGYLQEIYVKEGDYVQKGAKLFRVKPDVFIEQVNNSKAAYDVALAAEQSAKIELAKVKPLVEGKVYTELQLQTATANYEAAKATTAQAKAILESSRINADFSLITAPVSGYIGRIPNRAGNLISPSDSQPLTMLSEIDNIYAYFSLSEADFISFFNDRKKSENEYSSVEMVMANGSLYEQKGKLEIASGNIDRTTGSIALKAVFPNPDKLLRAGGSGKIILSKDLDNIIAIPVSCVKDIQDKFFVFVLQDNKVKMKTIEIESRSGNFYIVKSGIENNEKLVLNRIDVLKEDMPVSATAVKNLNNQ